MTRWTFQIRWPTPFTELGTWETSNRRFNTAKDSAEALANHLAIHAENGTILLGRLKAVID